MTADEKQMLTVRVPMALRRRGGRKLILSPAGEQDWTPQHPQLDSALLNAVVRAFRWKRFLDNGTFATVSELAAAERMNVSYVAHVLRLTLLAPDLVESILNGRQPATMQLQPLMREFPLEWSGQLEFASMTNAPGWTGATEANPATCEAEQSRLSQTTGRG